MLTGCFAFVFYRNKCENVCIISMPLTLFSSHGVSGQEFALSQKLDNHEVKIYYH